MNEVEVDVVQAELFEGLVDCAGDVVDCVPDFGGYEEGGTGDARFADCDAEFGFVVVEFCAVEVVEACEGWVL